MAAEARHRHAPVADAYPLSRRVQYGNRFFRAGRPKARRLALADAIAQSCDVYFYHWLKLASRRCSRTPPVWLPRALPASTSPARSRRKFPGGTDYYDRVYGPRRWTSGGDAEPGHRARRKCPDPGDIRSALQMLASDGPRADVPISSTPSAGSTSASPSRPSSSRTAAAMISVVERGTARGAAVRRQHLDRRQDRYGAEPATDRRTAGYWISLPRNRRSWWAQSWSSLARAPTWRRFVTRVIGHVSRGGHDPRVEGADRAPNRHRRHTPCRSCPAPRVRTRR